MPLTGLRECKYCVRLYVTGRVPAGKDPRAIDEKLIKKFGIDVSESTRARRKQAGRANLQYLRHERFFVLLATKGAHPFFANEGESIRDIRRLPLRYAGYSISYRRGGLTKKGTADLHWHAHVRLDRQQYLDLRAELSEWALKASTAELAKAFSSLPVAAYAPVRRQLLTAELLPYVEIRDVCCLRHLRSDQYGVTKAVVVKAGQYREELLECFTVSRLQSIVQFSDTLFDQFHCFFSFHVLFSICIIAAGICDLYLQDDLAGGQFETNHGKSRWSLGRRPSSSERRRRERTLTPWYDENCQRANRVLA